MDPTMDWQTQMVVSAREHFMLLVLIGLAAWWGFPKMFNKVLDNGGGKKLRAMMDEATKAANKEQSEAHREMTRQEIAVAIKTHEETERRNTAEMLDDLRREVTGEYPLEPPPHRYPNARRRPVRRRAR